MRKVGPGVDTKAPTLEGPGGLFAQRVRDGDETGVRLMATNGEAPTETGSNLRLDATLSDAEWSAFAEGALGVEEAK